MLALTDELVVPLSPGVGELMSGLQVLPGWVFLKGCVQLWTLTTRSVRHTGIQDDMIATRRFVHVAAPEM